MNIPNRVKKKTWKQRIAPVLNSVRPATKVIESVANIAVHLKKPTIFGVAMAASAGANALRDFITEPAGQGTHFYLSFSREYLIGALVKVGARTTKVETGDGNTYVDVELGDLRLRMFDDASVYVNQVVGTQFIKWLRDLLDPGLPPIMNIQRSQDGKVTSLSQEPITLTSKQGAHILSQTMPMLKNGRHRTILLTGIPGVGKSTMAQEIAQATKLGRIVHLDPLMVGSERNGVGNRVIGIETGLTLLNPGVVIVDDIHRINLSLLNLETIRKVAKLVILTANLPKDDDGETLDGAEIRSGRIDEVFEIIPEHNTRQPPFDKLPDDVWERVKFWPIAFLNDLELRLIERPDNLRIDDLERRVGLKTKTYKDD